MIIEPRSSNVTMNVYLNNGEEYLNVDIPSCVNDESNFLSFWEEENKLTVVKMENVNFFQYIFEEE